MTTIDINAQQIVVDALAKNPKNNQKTILCHTPSKLSAEPGMYLSTQDRLQELFTSGHDSVVAIFPNASLVRRLCKNCQQDTFSIELVFACHASCDPNDLVIDLLGKFAVECKFIQSASFLAFLPQGTFRKRQPYIAYSVKVTHDLQDSLDLQWFGRTTAAYEAMIPKAIAEIPEVKKLLMDNDGPLRCKSIKRNSCFDVSNIGNCFSYVFSSSCFDHTATVEAVQKLVTKRREFAEEVPSSVIQVKPGTVWSSVDSIGKSVIFLRSLETSQIIELAQQLTGKRINFYFSSPNILVLDLVGVSTAALVRLLHYSEIPVPTSMIQGAFSVSFINWGKSYGDHGMTVDPLTLQRYKVSIGRITALHSVPMQIKWEDIQESCEPSIEQSKIPQWLKAECQGTCPTKVLAIDEERTVDWYLHFFVPQKIETTFPKQVVFEGKKILIEHALPFAPIRSSITRPPIEETMHEHWKNTASLAPDRKKHRSNCLVHDEDCFPSLQRVNMLQEISVKSRGLKLSGSFEASTTPILFLNGMPDIEDGLSAFVSITSQVTEIAADVEFSVEKHLQQPRSGSEHSNQSGTLYVLSIQCTDHVPLSIGKVFHRRNGCAVSTTELLKCHAFTECLLLLILPKGIKIDGICTPKRHFDIVVRIPIVSQRGSEKDGCPSPLTPLGHNATQLSLRGHTTDQDKPSPSCVKQQSYVSFAQAQTDDGGERHSQSHGPREHSEKSKQAPEPVVVDGCRNSSSKKQDYKDSTERDETAAAILTSYAAPLEDLQSENEEVPAQPVVVDGCGEHTAPVFKTESSQWKVSPTAIWTAIPRELADIRNPEQLPEKTKCRKEEGERLKQNCEERVRGENKHESQDQIKMYQALEPIPESDGHSTNYDETLSKEGGNKPKALPLKVTPTVRQHLAKISAASVTQKHLASRKSGSMPALSQEENRKTSCDATPSPMEEEPALTGIPGTQVPASHTEEIMPGNRPVVQLGENIRTIQRSRSAGHPPLTPNRKANSVSNSRSCPPKRVKSSPIREVIKSGKKIPKDASPGLEHEKKGNQGSKGKQGGLPLRRAGLDTSRKLNFFAKPNGIPKLPGTGLACKEKEEGDTLMIDVESIIVADEIRKQAIAVEQVRDASGKWLTDYPVRKRNEIEQLAVRFLLTMNSTLCFFTVAMRMLSKAPWTESMASVDVRQFALVAISRGWYVKQLASTKHSFTRAELALAAGVYEGLITPTLPDDTTVALRTIIDHLPEACNSMFSKAEVTCPFCHARSNSVVTTFSSCISWKDQTWTNLKQALAQAQPFVGHLPRNWHAEGCNRDDQDPKITKLGKWLYLELRPYPILKNDFFPFLSESSALILDDSLVTEGLHVDCLVCSNLCAGESRHYWLVEINEGKVQQIYDSLQGVQPLTQEIYRMLQVTGILLKSTSSSKPVLKCPQLEQKAGIIEAVSRRAPTIKVASRSRTCKTRHELVKSMNRLSIAPTKAYGVSKKLGKKMKGVNIGLKQVDTHERLLLPRSSTAKKPQASGPARKRAKKKTHPKRTQKAGTPGNRLHKGIGEFLSQPKLHELGQPIVARDEVDDTVESVSDDAGDGDSRQSLAAKEKPLQQEARTNLDNASDPISDFVTQQNDGDNHPQREKKRTFEQADLEGVGPVTVDTEDNMRRKQGPPKVSDVSPEGQQCPTDTGQEFHHAARYQYEETKAASGENASKEESGINEAAYAGNERSKQEGPPPCTPGTACCKALPVQSRTFNNQTEGKGATPVNAVSRGRYGIISLFDGVSSVVPILRKKLGYPPTAVILAECDLSLRQLVCTEFGYRSDEKWGFTPEGSAVLYVKDVHYIIAGQCKVLHDLVRMFPDCKWIIVGGSPCQDLTFAGPWRGLLGLIGPSSRLFFVLLCVISAMQRLVGPTAVRYLVENAASMLQIHLDAFCQLLRIPVDYHGRYVWDPCDFGFEVTRRRNYFRNFDDIEEIGIPTRVFESEVGPLIDQAGKCIPFAPLLRTREVLPYGIIRASWTLYQPHALVWNYAFWNGRINFGKACRLGANKIPHLKWEQIVPPPFLKAWFRFLRLCENRNMQGNEIDEALAPLLPLFHCDNFCLPFRILKETEVAALSGLRNFWTRTSIENAEALPEHLVRNYCGNSFHPDLISSALGNNIVLSEWVNGNGEGPHSLVAEQSEAFQVFSSLCDKVEAEAKRTKRKGKLTIDRTLPPFQVVSCVSQQQPAHEVSVQQQVLPPLLGGCPKIRVTKAERRVQQCIDAALHKLEEKQCVALKERGLGRLFDGLRAPRFISFHFADYAESMIGEDLSRLRQFACRFPQQSPSLQAIDELKRAFTLWERQPTLCTTMAVLIAGANLKKESSWPLGHVVLLPGRDASQLCYIGEDTPKMLLLVNAARPQAPETFVVEATAFPGAMRFGQLLGACQNARPYSQVPADPEFHVELRDGQAILNIGGYHCQQEGCLTCFLTNCAQLPQCPWHAPQDTNEDRLPLSFSHFICTKDPSTSIVEFVGQLKEGPTDGIIQVFHVCTNEQLRDMSLYRHVTPSKVSLFHSSLSEANTTEDQFQQLVQPFQHVELPQETYRHLFVRAGGPASSLDVWLRERSRE